MEGNSEKDLMNEEKGWKKKNEMKLRERRLWEGKERKKKKCWEKRMEENAGKNMLWKINGMKGSKMI